MNTYESLIDRTNFGLIADYLRNPRSSIEHLLHVKEPAMLSQLAEHLDHAMESEIKAARNVATLIDGFIREGVLMISSKHPLTLPDPSQLINADTILRSTVCHVIYLPPFYLVHTLGLFDGTLIRNTVTSRETASAQHPTERQMKL